MSSKRKPLASLARPAVKQSAKAPVRARIDETRTAVSTDLSSKLTQSQAEAIEISSDSSSHYSSSDNEDGASEDDEATRTKTDSTPADSKSRRDEEDAVMTSPKPAAREDDEKDDEDEEVSAPTFGDLVRSTTHATIDVPAALAEQALAKASAAAQAAGGAGSSRRKRHADASNSTEVVVDGAPAISSTSLGTVLNQALRTDDADLLESCLQTQDYKIVHNTINRMDSALAGILLSKLAARMHRRPGRAFGLMKWIQGTLIAHGGSLVTQPDLVNRLSELSRVLEERSRGLSSLLALKGKLDMLDQQVRFRKSIKAGGSRNRITDGREGSAGEEDEESDDEDVDEPAVVYVEGEENQPIRALTNGSRSGAAAGLLDDEDDDFPVGGLDGDSDEESDEEDDADDMELADVESLDEDEVDHDDIEESADEDDSDEEDDAGPPAKVQKVSLKFAKRK